MLQNFDGQQTWGVPVQQSMLNHEEMNAALQDQKTTHSGKVRSMPPALPR